MNRKKPLKIIGYVIVIIVGLVIILILNSLVNFQRVQDPVKKDISSVDHTYNKYGLVGDEKRSETIVAETESVVIYEDRVLEHFNYEAKNLKNLIKTIEGLKKSNQGLKNIFIVPVPPSIVMEDAWFYDREKYKEYINQLNMSMTKGVSLIDVLPSLDIHREEYIFFRTENTWTARGAYYGTTALCSRLGIEPISLDMYEEHVYKEFYGSLHTDGFIGFEQDEGVQLQRSMMKTDPLFYYILPGSKNREKLTLQEDGQVKSVKRPLISNSSTGVGTFVANKFISAVVDGNEILDEKKGETLMVICDKGGNIMIPYLSDYYKRVYVVHIEENELSPNDICEIIDNYDIKDLVVVQDAQRLGNGSYSAAINQFNVN